MFALLACHRLPPSVADDSGTSPFDTDTDTHDPGTDTDPPVITGPSFTAIGFNVESDGADPAIVADTVVAEISGETLWGFAEVESEAAADLLVGAAGPSFEYVIGTTGWSDRLVLAWDNDVFALLDFEELDDINVGGTARAPVVGRMREREHGFEFLFVVNHLWRTDEPARHEQATLLNEWGREQTEPILMVGDYNFDWQVDGGGHDQGYDNLTADGVFDWVEPDPIVKTQCSGYYDSVLDFAFLGGDAQSWGATSEVLRTDHDYCREDPDNYSDHRPVSVTLTVPE